MSPEFSDHFAPVASTYAEFRPRYPGALFDWLSSITPGRRLAWDCACGSGQATGDLAQHFDSVIATDASASQIHTAHAMTNVEYRVSPVEHSGITPGSVDLIVVAQALHWFDVEAFYQEVRRVGRQDSALAVWSYGIHSVEGEGIDSLIHHFYWDTVGAYWPPERRHVENGYSTLPFPFESIDSPSFTMSTNWTLRELLGYLRSWSATGKYSKLHCTDPVAPLGEQLAGVWGDFNSTRRVTWPLTLKVGRVNSTSQD